MHVVTERVSGKVPLVIRFIICLCVLYLMYHLNARVGNVIQDRPFVNFDGLLKFSSYARSGKIHPYDPENIIKTTDRKFVETENNTIFILGAVAKNSTPTKVWDKIAMYGQWKNFQDVKVENLRCCFRYKNDQAFESNISDYNIRNYERGMLRANFLVLWHITCDRPSFFPDGVSITRSMSCNNTHVSYIEPYYATKKPDGYIVITTKLAYGIIDPEVVVSFLEAIKYVGVNKVVTYVYKT